MFPQLCNFIKKFLTVVGGRKGGGRGVGGGGCGWGGGGGRVISKIKSHVAGRDPPNQITLLTSIFISSKQGISYMYKYSASKINNIGRSLQRNEPFPGPAFPV